MRPGTRRMVAAIMMGLLLVATPLSQARLDGPRIEPLSEDAVQWTADARQSVEMFGGDGTATNLAMTLARHPAALKGLAPLAGYIRRDAMVPAVDQVLLALRSAWLCQSQAIWAEQAAEARAFGLSDADLRRVAEGADAGWGPWDATVIRAADELYHDSFLSEETWAAMAGRYNAQQLIDVIFTAAEYVMLSMMANSFGVQPDSRFGDRLPADVPGSIRPTRPSPLRLDTARLPPLPEDEWTDEQRSLLDPTGSGRPTINLYRTLARHPVFYRPRAEQSRYIRTGSTLPGRARELLILRMGWLCGSEYEWAQHVPIGRQEGLTEEEIYKITVGPDAPGWSRSDTALLAAADELHRDSMVGDATWLALSLDYGEQALMDVVITSAGYRMVSIALNSLGVQLEPGKDGFPSPAR